jgi:hypothetical protein
MHEKMTVCTIKRTVLLIGQLKEWHSYNCPIKRTKNAVLRASVMGVEQKISNDRPPHLLRFAPKRKFKNLK